MGSDLQVVKQIHWVWVAIALHAITGCYSFRGISIPQEVRTFYIDEFENRAPNSPIDLGQILSEKLKEKVIRESRLTFNDENPDIEFVGTISRFYVSAQAPQPEETIAFNRLEISASITYQSNLDENNNWQSNFSFYQDYERDQNLLDIQDQLIEAINEQIVEDIFNRAFTNW